MKMQTIIVQDTDKSILEVLTLALELENFKVYPLQDCDADFMDFIQKTCPQVEMLDYRIDGKKCLNIL